MAILEHPLGPHHGRVASRLTSMFAETGRELRLTQDFVPDWSTGRYRPNKKNIQHFTNKFANLIFLGDALNESVRDLTSSERQVAWADSESEAYSGLGQQIKREIWLGSKTLLNLDVVETRRMHVDMMNARIANHGVDLSRLAGVMYGAQVALGNVVIDPASFDFGAFQG